MNTEILIVTVVLLLGAAVGAALAWLLLKTKAGAVTAAELATLKERLAGKENEFQKHPSPKLPKNSPSASRRSRVTR